MKKIVPGGYYSYDAAGKKIWLDYSYYGVGLENIDRIRNLSKNLDLYSSSGAGKPISVANGCITHSYQGTEADTDKIQVTLKTPITNSLTELTPVDGVVTLETDGKVLVLPTSNAAILPSFNEYVLNNNRLTLAESPFGGLKGSGGPDYVPGTLNVISGDGVYLTDTSGTNSTKTLTAGKLKELSLLTVDTTGHSLTEEFVIRNDNVGQDVTVIDDCSSETDWSISAGTGVITVENGRLKVEGTSGDTNGLFILSRSTVINATGKSFFSAKVQANINCSARIRFNAPVYKIWQDNTRFALVANTNTTYVLPIDAPQGTTGALPSTVSGTFNKSSFTLSIGIVTPSPSTAATFYIDDIQMCNGTLAQVEVAVPDNLSATSTIVQCYSGSTYSECRRDSLDGAYSNISSTPANMKLLDGTKFDDVYGSGLGRAYFPKGASGETKAGSSGNITYSVNKGTRNRIGFRVDLPPSDGGRTNFNKVRLKVITNYAADAEGNYSASFDFADSTNTSYGLQNLSLPWIALYDPANSLIDFYLFTHRPQNLSFKRDETGTIYSLSLYPGAGSVYHGQIPFADLTLDTNSDTIPDCLEAAVNGSVTKFLENYAVIVEDPQDPENPEDPDIAQLLSNDNYELMSNDNKYLYSEV